MLPGKDLKTMPSSKPIPLAYFLTFSCYGTWLHGKASGSVDRDHNRYGTPFLPPDIGLMDEERDRLTQEPYLLDAVRREIVLKSFHELCGRRRWLLLAAHVRSKHAHLVLRAPKPPERVLNDLKSNASRMLNEAGLDTRERMRWTRHGSTKYLWTPKSVEAAMRYVVFEQGERMAVFEGWKGLWEVWWDFDGIREG
jgi:REP element-mobilizing transposase RayT